MAGAAALLGISRPAIAKRIRNLEVMAGQALLHRSGRGVALTDAGAALLASARRLLGEREVMLRALARIRGEGPRVDEGLHRLLSPAPAHARVAQQPETRLAEAEELLELVLQTSATGMVICDLESGEVLVVNDAFCELAGRTRQELVGSTPASCGLWEESSAREQIVERVRSSGRVEPVPVRIRRPDGEVRTPNATARLITLAGTRRMLWCADAFPSPDGPRRAGADGGARRAGVDGAGVDGAGVDGVSVDGVSVDGARVDGVGVDGVGVDRASVSGRSVSR